MDLRKSSAFCGIVDEFNDVKGIYPIHLNPKVREVANVIFNDCDKVKLIEPLEVFDFHNFQNID